MGVGCFGASSLQVVTWLSNLSILSPDSMHYAIKRVRPIFVEEPAQIVVVTVYVYYF